MLVIRYFRIGKKNQPYFKVVVTDKKMPVNGGRFVEEVGFIDPVKKKKNLKADRIKYWISVGAQPSDTVHNLLISEKIIEGKKIPVHHKKKIKEGETPVVQKTAPVAAPVSEKPKDVSSDSSTKAQGAKAEASAKEETPKAEPKPAAEPQKQEAPKQEEKKAETPVQETANK